ncbi:MAG: serine/threonine-protein kinase [Bryobacteraceae bacterium]
MPACRACGGEIVDQNRFCPSCGAPVESEVESDGSATRTVASATTPGRNPSSSGQAPSRLSSSSRGVHAGRFAPGALLAGRYRIVALLGKGGMGEVYRADDLQLDQPVALKLLPESLSRNGEAIARFRNEVRTARQVSHPNVCRVYDLTEIEGLYVLSMEYVDGEDLGSLLRRIGRLPSDKALEIARKLCAGLAAAHEKGVLHRDLKPSNIMLDGRGQVLLTDFGLAGLAGEIEGSEVRNGTPAYMAPEQLAGLEVTVKSDIYALGLVLYEIFTGKLPFASDTLAGLVQARAESTPVSPTTLVRDLDPLVEKVILRCLQAKPSLRPASALAVAAALPGGDRLAAALAAGETPSPEMVAEAGEGQGLSPRVAFSLLAAILVVLAVCASLALQRSALERMRPPYSPEVLAQKARDLIATLGYNGTPADSAAGFSWYSEFTQYASAHDKPHPKWSEILAGQPSPLHFWYRQADSDLFAGAFHDDWLTPGMLDRDDPPPVEAGMTYVVLDDRGRLIRFETVPRQRLENRKQPAPALDWSRLFAAAGLDASKLQAAEPLWTWLATSDTRAAWTGTWPGSARPLRVEAAALEGKPVAFMLMGPWTSPWREPSPDAANGVIIVLVCLLMVVLTAGPWLARRNFLKGRGDRRGAFRLGCFFSSVLMGMWLMRAHFAGVLPAFGMLLVAMATSLFYGVAIWMVYLAVEPYVRRRWPQCLISWTSALSGRLRDPVVGRDVLIGAALGVSFAVVNVLINLPKWKDLEPIFSATVPLDGMRSAIGGILAGVPQGIRSALLFVFFIFLLRALLRSQWAAGAAFALLFSLINFLGSGNSWLAFGASLVIYGVIALVMLRWGILASCVGVFLGNIAQEAPITTHAGEWFFGSALLSVAVILALTFWGAWTSLGGRRIFQKDLFE